MGAKVINFFTRLARPLTVTGPIFTKELRVASRRGRTYLLRAAYLAVLMAVLVLVWLAKVDEFDQANTYNISRMSEAGKDVIAWIVWFQFIAAQMVAIVLMSTSISGEVQKRTLGILRTTPVTSFQIVAGKLLGKLWQIMILLAVSLPLMAIVRVFGGVPWWYVIAGLCCALTAAVFAGAIAMFYSAVLQRAYASILLTLATQVGLYVFVSGVVGVVAAVLSLAGTNVLALVIYLNPYWAMALMTEQMFRPGSTFIAPGFYWPVHCVVMLGLSVGTLLLAKLIVRRVVMREAAGGRMPLQPGPIRPLVQTQPVQAAPPVQVTPPPQAAGEPPVQLDLGENAPTGAEAPPPAGPSIVAFPEVPPMAPPSAAPQPLAAPPPARPLTPAQMAQLQYQSQAAAYKKWYEAYGPVRPIPKSPLLWREMRQPLFRSLGARIAIPLVGGLFLLFTYLIVGGIGGFEDGDDHGAFVFGYVALAVLSTAVLAATSLAAEKESRTLPLLLTTSLSDWQILGAKLLGTLRRSAIVWILLGAHVLLFSAVGMLNVLAVAHTILLAAWTFGFVAAAGLYFGSRFRKTTTAVLMSFALVLVLWVVLPVLLSLLTKASRATAAAPVLDGLTRISLALNPAMEGWVLVHGARESTFLIGGRSMSYDWPDKRTFGATGGVGTTVRMLCYTAIYLAAGGLLLWRAKRNLRKYAF